MDDTTHDMTHNELTSVFVTRTPAGDLMGLSVPSKAAPGRVPPGYVTRGGQLDPRWMTAVQGLPMLYRATHGAFIYLDKLADVLQEVGLDDVELIDSIQTMRDACQVACATVTQGHAAAAAAWRGERDAS